MIDASGGQEPLKFGYFTYHHEMRILRFQQPGRMVRERNIPPGLHDILISIAAGKGDPATLASMLPNQEHQGAVSVAISRLRRILKEIDPKCSVDIRCVGTAARLYRYEFIYDSQK